MDYRLDNIINTLYEYDFNRSSRTEDKSYTITNRHRTIM